MYVIDPMVVTDAELTSSNVSEDDHLPWDSATGYSQGDRVIVISTHSVYQAVATNTNKDPTLAENIFSDTNPSGVWLRVGATNRWKAFDKRISEPVVNATSIDYEILVSSRVTSIAFFGLVAGSVNITVTDAFATEIYNETIDLIDTDEITDWLEFFLWEPEFVDTKVVDGIPAYSGNTIHISILGSTAQVGQIVMGKITRLGYTSEGTIVGFDDFSTKERNETFGYVEIQERSFSDYIDFKFTINYSELAKVERLIKKLRATPAVWMIDPKIDNLSSTVYGFQSGSFRPVLKSTGLHSATLEIEGLT